MRSDEILQRLAACRQQLAEFHVKSLAVFGSVARRQARADSDVDVLVEFNGPARFDQYMNLKLFLEERLGRPVDLLTRKGIRPELLPSVQQEAVYVSWAPIVPPGHVSGM